MQQSPEDHRTDRPGRTTDSMDAAPRTAISPDCGKGLRLHLGQDGHRGANRKGRAVAWTVAGIVVLSLVILGCVYRGHLFSALDLVDEATGNRTITVLSLVFLLLALVCMALWMILPMILYLGLKDLGRRTASLDQTMRLFISHLAQPKPVADVPQTRPAPEEKPPGTEVNLSKIP